MYSEVTLFSLSLSHTHTHTHTNTHEHKQFSFGYVGAKDDIPYAFDNPNYNVRNLSLRD